MEDKTNSSSTRHLRRSTRDRVIAGVCSGVADYLSAPPLLVRVIWIAACFWKGVGVLAYILAVLIVPRDHVPQPENKAKRNAKVTIGAILIIVGLLFILQGQFNLYRLWHVNSGLVMPIILMLIGLGLLLRGRQETPAYKPPEPPPIESEKPITPTGRRLRRSRNEKIVLGICGGIGNHFGVDPVLVRVAWVAGTLLTEGAGVVLYLLMYLVLPQEPVSNSDAKQTPLE